MFNPVFVYQHCKDPAFLKEMGSLVVQRENIAGSGVYVCDRAPIHASSIGNPL